jgi:hypothetical protein
MNIDSAPLKSNVDNTEQAKAILSALTNSHLASTSESENKKKQEAAKILPTTDANRRNVALLANNYNKPFREYLDELKQACASDIYIKRTSNIKYMAKKWSNIQAYIVSVTYQNSNLNNPIK